MIIPFGHPIYCLRFRHLGNSRPHMESLLQPIANDYDKSFDPFAHNTQLDLIL